MKSIVLGLNLVCLYCVTALLSAGCGKGADNRPARVPVTVTVTYRGAAVEGAVVTLHPAAQDGKPAFGRTDAQGRAVLSTFGDRDGAMPGDYAITVVKTEDGSNAAETPPSEIGAMPANSPGGAPPPPPSGPRHLLPAKYADVNTSGLRQTIQATGDNNFTLELTD